MKKKLPTLAASFLTVAAAYYAIEYLFFDLHGMKDWPLVLFIITELIVMISAAAKKTRVPRCATLGYIVGFILGVKFEQISYDPGGGAMSNTWKIWTIVLIVSVLIGVLSEFLFSPDKRRG